MSLEIERAYSADEVEEAFRTAWNASASKACLWDELSKEDRVYWRAVMPFRRILSFLPVGGNQA